MKKWMSVFALCLMGVATSLLYANCSPSNSSSNAGASAEAAQAANVDFYFRKMTHLKVEVAYEPGAEPYTGTTAAGLNYWDLLKENLAAVFQGRPVTFEIPQALSQMQQIPAQNQTSWTAGQVLDLAEKYRTSKTEGSQGSFFIVFLKGYSADSSSGGNGTNPNVIGFSVTGTPVIAIFKQVVQSTGTLPNGPVPKYVEQSTLVHEMGHALGFVNNGLPLTTAHHDAPHGAHCTNPNCVMNYLNEGKSDMASFVQQYIQSGSTVMFDQQCLQDAHNF